MLGVTFNQVLHYSFEPASILVAVGFIVFFNCKTNILNLLERCDTFDNQVHLCNSADQIYAHRVLYVDQLIVIRASSL
jgi:hypothetical protein